MNEPAPHGIRPLACVQPAGNPREGPLKTAPGRATTDLARTAAAEGRQLVIAAGGDGTVNEVAHGLADTETVLGLMPLGSVMNVARTLWVPRDLALAARPIAEGKVLAMGLGRIGDRFFLETAGVGLDAGLFGYFERLEEGGRTSAPHTPLRRGRGSTMVCWTWWSFDRPASRACCCTSP